MEASLLVQYGVVLLILIVLEGILAADNALVLAVMVKHLPEEKRKKALFYGLAGAFVFRFISLFMISFLVDVWQVQAIGAIYLMFIACNHLVKTYLKKNENDEEAAENEAKEKKKNENFWWTVFKVEVADIAFAIDSILAAVALAITLPKTGLGTIGGLDTGQFIIIFVGGLIGVVIMRFAASAFVKLLHRKPGLETAAFLIVGWVGVKLAVITLAHPAVGIIPEEFPHSATWEITFWAVLASIAVGGWFLSKDKTVDTQEDEKKYNEKAL